MRQFGIFAKYWEPGRVKTRLGQTVGHQRASDLYRAMVECLLRRFAGFPARRVLSVTPAERFGEMLAAIEAIASGHFSVESQGEGDLGERMAGYFQRAFSQGCTQAVLVGSDTPQLTTDTVERAFAQLQDFEVVLGPAEDGGYYLVGASRRVPPIFDQMPWSTDQLWEATWQRLSEHGIQACCLPKTFDIDTESDLRRLIVELRQRQPLQTQHLLGECQQAQSHQVGEASLEGGEGMLPLDLAGRRLLADLLSVFAEN